MPFWLLSARNGYETIGYKALAALFNQMRPAAEKAIANCRKSAHDGRMSEQHHVVACRFVGLRT
jgi:hypothetical protein